MMQCALSCKQHIDCKNGMAYSGRIISRSIGPFKGESKVTEMGFLRMFILFYVVCMVMISYFCYLNSYYKYPSILNVSFTETA